MGTFGILFLLVYQWSPQIFSSDGIFVISNVYFDRSMSVTYSLNFIYMQRNLLTWGNISSKGKVWKFLSKISVNSVLTRSFIMGFNAANNGSHVFTLVELILVLPEKQHTFSVNEEQKVSIWIILRKKKLHTHATTVLSSLWYHQRFNSIPCSLCIPYQLTPVITAIYIYADKLLVLRINLPLFSTVVPAVYLCFCPVGLSLL